MMTSIVNHGDEIAIIGMAGRFPGARDVEGFWHNLCGGVESVTFFTNEELAAAGIDAETLQQENYIKASAILDDVESFDAAFFDIAAREAEILDPQQRLFLECAWTALENAGYDAQRYEGLIGVYGGEPGSNYKLYNLLSNPEIQRKVSPMQLSLGNDQDFLTTRVSYKLNLRGPSIVVQTACSTSLVAVHLACQALLVGDCDMALAGGVSINIPQKQGYMYHEGDISSPDGHCRAFDEKALGSIKGSGVGIVVLKTLEQARDDGDYIHAIIKGSAVNNDGSLKIGFTAPSVECQADVVRAALAAARVEAEMISYVEAHGSGTVLGDPIEIEALSQAFQADKISGQFCGVGSVKTNIGHLGPAAGIAGLIKTVMALKEKKLPPSLHFERPNPNIDFAHSHFYVNNRLREWVAEFLPRRAGVSSFGIGGTNAHVILEESISEPSESSAKSAHLLLLSARTSSALETMTDNLATYLQQHQDLDLADVAYTLQKGRRELKQRRFIVCHTIEDAISAITTRNYKRIITGLQESKPRPVAFMFPGLGDHYIGMAHQLYQSEPVFREHIDLCCAFLTPLLGYDLREILYGGQRPTEKETINIGPHENFLDLRAMLKVARGPLNETEQALNRTELAHPVLFVIESALVQLWQSLGIKPQAMIGYSLGEYVAAYVAGVLSLEDALTLVTRRAQLIQTLPESAMLAISLASEKVQPYLTPELALSALNGPTQCIVSGSVQAIEILEQRLAEENTVYRRLSTTHAFHSPLMQPIVASFAEVLKTIQFHAPQIPYISSVTGTWITVEEACDPSYWVKHLCETVRFSHGIATLWQEQNFLLLEVGPGNALSASALQQVEGDASRVALPSLRPVYDQRTDIAFLLNTMGKLWLSGIQLQWSEWYSRERRCRIPLPTYPFERQRYWISPRGNSIMGTPNYLNNVSGTTDEVETEVTPSYHPRPQLLSDYVAPTNEIENSIAEIWQEILGIAPVSIHDNFFELGGHSLSSIQLVFRLRQVFQVPVPLDYPFKVPILADLAIVIEEMFLAQLEALPEEDAEKLIEASFNEF